MTRKPSTPEAGRPSGRHDQATDLLRLARLLSFLAAVGLGATIGWRLFLAPKRSASEEPAADPAAALQEERQALVQPIGSPATGLGSRVRIGSPAPDFTLRSLNGEPFTLSELSGHVVLINFWTSWCPPCQEEMPALQQAYEQFADQGLTVLGVNWTQADDAAAAAAFAQDLGLTFPILLDPDGAVSEDLYLVVGLPTSVLIGRDGMVRALRIGILDLEDLESNLEALLSEDP